MSLVNPDYVSPGSRPLEPVWSLQGEATVSSVELWWSGPGQRRQPHLSPSYLVLCTWPHTHPLEWVTSPRAFAHAAVFITLPPTPLPDQATRVIALKHKSNYVTFWLKTL